MSVDDVRVGVAAGAECCDHPCSYRRAHFTTGADRSDDFHLLRRRTAFAHHRGAGQSHPSGAGALCHDGTYSYSTTPQGTRSHHSGVEVWYY
ncbi:DUF3761 domain-containing protein [Catenulispora rubra]|uniref:DUF3761 domain-containing protein n=1 Tax=Catenulispora rubra TaxID=280293 RepID=UPI0018925EF3|nr:DUF3761 domain-containing protein [Catenulispora rubra]